MLQLSEATVPFMNLIAWFERSGLRHSKPRAYCGLRWSFLLVWLLFRILLFAFFGSSVHRHWNELTPLGNVLGVGSLATLLPFNIVSLFIVATPGCPWMPLQPACDSAIGAEVGKSDSSAGLATETPVQTPSSCAGKDVRRRKALDTLVPNERW